MNDPVIDHSAIDRLLRVIGGDIEDLRELIEEFLTSTPELVSRMEKAAEDGNLDTLRITSHTLKANGRDFGASSLAALCERLEGDCKSGLVEDPVGQVAMIARQLVATREALGRMVTDHE